MKILNTIIFTGILFTGIVFAVAASNVQFCNLSCNDKSKMFPREQLNLISINDEMKQIRFHQTQQTLMEYFIPNFRSNKTALQIIND